MYIISQICKIPNGCSYVYFKVRVRIRVGFALRATIVRNKSTLTTRKVMFCYIPGLEMNLKMKDFSQRAAEKQCVG